MSDRQEAGGEYRALLRISGNDIQVGTLELLKAGEGAKKENLDLLNHVYGKQPIFWHVQMVAPIEKGKTKNTEHPTHQRPAPGRNTLLTVDLPHRGTPYSPWTCLTAEHPTHCGPAPLRNTLLTTDLPCR